MNVKQTMSCLPAPCELSLHYSSLPACYPGSMLLIIQPLQNLLNGLPSPSFSFPLLWAEFEGVLLSTSSTSLFACISLLREFPRWLGGKESACQCGRCRFDPWVEKNPWRRKWQPTPIFLPGAFHAQRSLAGPWGCKEMDMTKTTKTATLF